MPTPRPPVAPAGAARFNPKQPLPAPEGVAVGGPQDLSSMLGFEGGAAGPNAPGGPEPAAGDAPIDAEIPPPIQAPPTPPAAAGEGPRTFARPGTEAAIPFRGVRFGAMAAGGAQGQLPGLPNAMGAPQVPPPRQPGEDETAVLGILQRLQGA